jgi:hypothetical protein
MRTKADECNLFPCYLNNFLSWSLFYSIPRREIHALKIGMVIFSAFLEERITIFFIKESWDRKIYGF